MKIIDLPRGLAFHVRSNDSEFYKELKKIFNLNRITFFDPCCSVDATEFPLRFSTTNSTIERFDVATNTWIEATTSNVQGSTTGITAHAGGGQGSAVALTTEYNEVTVSATAGDSVKLPAAATGLKIVVKNNGATAIDVFPATADKINDGTVNTAVRVAPSASVTFNAIDAINWETSNQVLSTNTITEQSSGSGITLAKPVIQKAGTAKAVDVTGAITAAELAGGYITSTSAAAVSATLPTASLLATQLGAVAGTRFQFTVDNSSGANTVTIVVNTGITVNTSPITGGSTLTVSTANAVAIFELFFTSTTTAKLLRIA